MKRKVNSKIIALIVEVVLILTGATVAFILEQVGKPVHWVVLVVVGGILLFSLVLTLSIIRYNAYRSIDRDISIKESNMPLYTDQTTMLAHDMIEEKEHKDYGGDKYE